MFVLGLGGNIVGLDVGNHLPALLDSLVALLLLEESLNLLLVLLSLVLTCSFANLLAHFLCQTANNRIRKVLEVVTVRLEDVRSH